MFEVVKLAGEGSFARIAGDEAIANLAIPRYAAEAICKKLNALAKTVDDAKKKEIMAGTPCTALYAAACIELGMPPDPTDEQLADAVRKCAEERKNAASELDRVHGICDQAGVEREWPFDPQAPNRPRGLNACGRVRWLAARHTNTVAQLSEAETRLAAAVFLLPGDTLVGEVRAVKEKIAMERADYAALVASRDELRKMNTETWQIVEIVKKERDQAIKERDAAMGRLQ